MPTKKLNKTHEILDKIFGDPSVIYGLKEFDKIEFKEVLEITEEEKNKFYVKDIKSGSPRLVYDETKQRAKPEEIVRQLWLYKLRTVYKYPLDRIEIEKSIHFGREVNKKSADIIVYKKDKVTPLIIIEVKSPTERKGIEQLKSYLNSEGAEIGLWSNGVKRIILYRPYPKEFSDTLPDLPLADQTIDDLLDAKKTLFEYTDPKADLKEIINSMEELVLANAGVDVFSEVFKLIYAKLFDENEARISRADHEIFFRKYKDASKTYQVINDLFKKSMEKWPGTFFEQDNIKLSPEHLSIVVGELEKARLFGSDLSIVDEAFEYLIPEVAKGKKGQYFTPRHVIAMAVKMLNPKKKENVIDPAAGSGGFLISTMNWVKERELNNSQEAVKEYAGEHLWGIDFAEEISKVSRALMLVAGDGRTHMFKLNSLDPREWQGEDQELLHARAELQKHLLDLGNFTDNADNKQSFHYFDFDVVLTNPPFAGEIQDKGLLRQYFFGKKKGKIVSKAERHILFIERTLNMLRPGGRMAIVLPQGVLNNTNMEYIREWLFEKARILAVVGLHGNTFKPHTGTKTSVLFLQKWGGEAGKPLKDYSIFMAVSKRGGKDNSGDYVFKKDKNGTVAHDRNGKKLLDHDLDDIADKFIEFARKEKLGV
ncbi:SAM-dependent methyltransferase [Candidatus Saganbacteria bacterium CG08_land_8_20_14_0_20_45_16]|uniref:SAM-dependent methyltransferase n=1 Tax=Candidatus Saganbacteria bacterium CG08_land_8_20_14_0_20_45_16 TaxID=2014293 RepID=A0A2H0Y1P9_UNCSA|nr:MAG: SAM-dependent methyltransferase [Candidatus Saganbacteria bacterium CG08_land_8_20_14_0_20_45_16]